MIHGRLCDYNPSISTKTLHDINDDDGADKGSIIFQFNSSFFCKRIRIKYLKQDQNDMK